MNIVPLLEIIIRKIHNKINIKKIESKEEKVLLIQSFLVFNN